MPGAAMKHSHAANGFYHLVVSALMQSTLHGPSWACSFRLHFESWTHLLIVIGKGSSNLQARVLVGVMYDDVVAVPSDVHGRKEIRAMQQECMAQAGNGASCHLEGCHCCPVVPPLHWDLCRQAEKFRQVKLVRQPEYVKDRAD